MLTTRSPATPGPFSASSEMRWVKDAEFIEIECASSITLDGPAFVVASSRSWTSLPLEFKEQVSITDEGARLHLYGAVKAWAEVSGFLPEGAV